MFVLSLLNFPKTTLICALLVIMSLLISKDAQELVLTPLETIMEKVNKMAVDPFQVIFFNDIDQGGPNQKNISGSEMIEGDNDKNTKSETT